MEGLGLKPFGGVYRGLRVLVTGHTGFKGSWLSAWLSDMGSEVTGFALSSVDSLNHWDLLQLPISDLRGDIRDSAAVQRVIQDSAPEIVFHLAAQPLVRRSYRDPLETWSTNVLGTANVLDACRNATDLHGVVIITTDKVYANNEHSIGYREDDRLGGHDPYSASKAATELVVDSYRKSFFSGPSDPLIATARAGNVIGGGDWSEDRLIPDIVRAVEGGVSLEIRSPHSTRPWQHVLECLSGYLLLGQRLISRDRESAEAWNFGPEAADNRSVSDVLVQLQRYWPELRWHESQNIHPHETRLLSLNSSKAKERLDWKPAWNLNQALLATANWYRERSVSHRVITREQVADYIRSAMDSGCSWAAR